MELNISGKKAIVTGNSKGIGLAISEELRKEGVIVPIIARSSGYDLMTPEGLYKLFDTHRLADILVCNLGGMGTCTLDDYETVMKKNYFTTVACIRNYIIEMEKNNWGRIIVISSVYGKEKGPNPVFVAAKSAQIGFIKSMCQLYENITFNTICPGAIDVGKSFPDNPKVIGKPNDVAGIVTFLCSDRAQHINGSCITCDGGSSVSF